MILYIYYDNTSSKGRLVASPSLPNYVWNHIKGLAVAVQPDVTIFGSTLEAEWATILAISPELRTLRGNHRFSIECDAQSAQQIRKYAKEYQATRAASSTHTQSITRDQIQTRLSAIGFTRRELTEEQLRDTSVLVGLAHGANFSVPGAGKTTVAFATHLLTKDDSTFLFVVAPKNAFVAWDEVITDTLDPDHPGSDITPFTRLTGGNIAQALRDAPRRMIISYDQLIRSIDVLRSFFHNHKVHVILDESHRMKSGDRSQRGAILLSIAHLPVRRDILSGTPIPRSIDDIASQLDFLWPGQGLGRRVASAVSPRKELRGLFVRTTKKELDLPPRKTVHVSVSMSQAQLALYGILRQEVLKRLVDIRNNSNVDLLAARKSVIRLLQVSSNPILAVKGMTNEEPGTYPYDDPKVGTIFRSIVAEKASPKIEHACDLARQFACEGQKTVIWTSFTENVINIAEMLKDLGATYIHGQVGTGSDLDEDTREGRIRKFHDNENCFVLVANPAACSEGISLHRVCHRAIYIDRTYNAAHYLQSIDRIHRLGLDPNTLTYIYIMESVAPNITGAIDYSVRRRLIEKLQIMSEALDDNDLRQLALDEEEGEQPVDYDIDLQDLKDIIDELMGSAPPPPDED